MSSVAFFNKRILSSGKLLTPSQHHLPFRFHLGCTGLAKKVGPCLDFSSRDFACRDSVQVSSMVYSNMPSFGCTKSLYQIELSAFLAVAIHIDEVKD